VKLNSSENLSTFSNIFKLFPIIQNELGSFSLDCLKFSNPKQCEEALVTAKNAVLLSRVKEMLVSLTELDKVPVDKINLVQTFIRDIKNVLEKHPAESENLKLNNNKMNSEKNEDEIDDLSDQDVLDLVENFDELDLNEKNNLIKYLSILEEKDQNRFKKLEQEVKMKCVYF
jgi:hypothetical protein